MPMAWICCGAIRGWILFAHCSLVQPPLDTIERDEQLSNNFQLSNPRPLAHNEASQEVAQHHNRCDWPAIMIRNENDAGSWKSELSLKGSESGLVRTWLLSSITSRNVRYVFYYVLWLDIVISWCRAMWSGPIFLPAFGCTRGLSLCFGCKSEQYTSDTGNCRCKDCSDLHWASTSV